MSEEIFPSRRSPSKGLLVIGIVLLVSSFLLFYLASSVGYDYATKHDIVVDVGSFYDDYANTTMIQLVSIGPAIMQPHDYLTVILDKVPINGTVSIVLRGEVPSYPWETTFPYTVQSENGFLDFRNELQTEMQVEVLLGSENQNTLSATTTLHHYETPNWLFFGAGVVLASLGLVAVFKSKR